MQDSAVAVEPVAETQADPPPSAEAIAEVERETADDAARTAAAIAGIQGLAAAPPPAAAPVALVAPPAPAAPAAEVVAEKPPERLEAVLRQRQTERLAKEQAGTEAAELQRLRAFEAEHRPAAAPDQASIAQGLLESLKSDPMGFLAQHGIDPREHLRTVSAAALNPEQAAIGRRLAAVEAAKPGPAGEVVDPRAVAMQVYQEQQQQTASEGEFAELCMSQTGEGEAATARYPLTAKLSRAEQVRIGNEIAIEFNGHFEADRDVFEQIAEIAEGRRELQYRSLVGTAPPHLLPPPAPSGPSTTSPGAVVTNELAAAGGARPPQTDAEREAQATKDLEVFFRNAPE